LELTVKWYLENDWWWGPIATDEVLHPTPWKLKRWANAVKLLVTGASGLLGSMVATLALKRGHSFLSYKEHKPDADFHQA